MPVQIKAADPNVRRTHLGIQTDIQPCPLRLAVRRAHIIDPMDHSVSLTAGHYKPDIFNRSEQNSLFQTLSYQPNRLLL